MINVNRTFVGNGFWKACFFCMLALWPTLTFSPSIMQVAVWLGLFFYLASLIARKQKAFFPDRISFYLLMGLLASIMISITISDYPKQSFRGLIKVLRQFAVFFVVFEIYRSQNFRNTWKVLLLASFILLATDGFYQYFFGVDFLRGFIANGSLAGRRISASFDNYGKLAAYLCAVLPVIIGITFQQWKQPGTKRLFWICLTVMLTGLAMLYLTRSRGAFLAFGLAWFFVLIFRRAWKLLVALLICAVIFVALMPRSMIIHLDADNKEQSIVERGELWHRAFDVIKARPLTGTGINTYAVAHQQFDTRKNWRVKDYYAHNGYLQMAAEIGLPGLIFFIAFILRWIWIHRPLGAAQGTEFRWGLLAGVFAFLIFCGADTALHSPQPVLAFWYVLALYGATHPKNQVT